MLCLIFPSGSFSFAFFFLHSDTTSKERGRWCCYWSQLSKKHPPGREARDRGFRQFQRGPITCLGGICYPFRDNFVSTWIFPQRSFCIQKCCCFEFWGFSAFADTLLAPTTGRMCVQYLRLDFCTCRYTACITLFGKCNVWWFKHRNCLSKFHWSLDQGKAPCSRSKVLSGHN